jgi:uncharacterized protein YrrD
MTSISMIRLGGLPVVDERGRRLGKIEHVLFAPGTKRAIGFQVERPPLLFIIRRRPRFLSFDATQPDRERVLVSEQGRGAWGRAAAKRLDISWDDTVIWLGMPVKSRSGDRLGTVRDALVDANDGKLVALGMSEGAVRDAAVGVRDIGAHAVIGFDGDAVRVTDEAADVELTGGAAAAAGRATAKATATARGAAETAKRYGSAAARAAEQTEAGRAATGWLRAARDAMRDAMSDDE